MSKKRGKRPGLSARSKNARAAKAPSKPRLQRLTKTLDVADFVSRPVMCFYPVQQGPPDEADLVLVRLIDETFRFGQVVSGRFAAFDPLTGTFVTMPHPERISHYMVVIDPVPKSGDAAHVEDVEPPTFTEQREESRDLQEDVYR